MFKSERDETIMPQLLSYRVDVHHLHRLGHFLLWENERMKLTKCMKCFVRYNNENCHINY